MPKPLMHPLPGTTSEQVRERLRRILAYFDEMRQLVPTPGAWLPPIDLCEMPDAILIRVELPGVRRDQVRMTINDNVLKIEGRKERTPPAGHETRAVRYLCLERSYGSFARTLVLQWPVEVGRISACFSAGVLTINVPKAPSCGREVVIPIGE
jgi:HSP20 family protein